MILVSSYFLMSYNAFDEFVFVINGIISGIKKIALSQVWGVERLGKNNQSGALSGGMNRELSRHNSMH